MIIAIHFDGRKSKLKTPSIIATINSHKRVPARIDLNFFDYRDEVAIPRLLVSVSLISVV